MISQHDAHNDIQINSLGRRPKLIKVEGRGNTIYVPENSELAGINLVVTGSNCTITIGSNVAMRGMIIIKGDGCRLTIGDNTKIVTGRLTLGRRTTMAIGERCLFSRNVEIRTTDEHPIYDRATRERINFNRDVSIGDECWLGEGARVSKGAVVPNGCVLGMGSLTSSVLTEPNSIYAGVPAKLIRSNIKWATSERDLVWSDDNEGS